MLLKATWPSDTIVPDETVNQIVKYSIPAFKYSRHDVDVDSDPYYMTLHKLWTKMCEEDWRTATKALYLLHAISRECTADQGKKFATTIKNMSKTRSAKAPEHRYFDARRFAEEQLGEKSAQYESFLTAYGQYVIFRAKTFSSKFKELSDLKPTKTTEKDAIAWLKKAQQSVIYGLACSVATKSPRGDQINVITGQVTRQVALDLRDLTRLFKNKLAPLLSTTDITARYAESSPALSSEIAELVKFYKESSPQVQSFLTQATKSFSRLRVKMPLPLTDEELTLTATPSRTLTSSTIDKLASGSHRGGAKVVRDEEDEVDEEEDEEEDDNEGIEEEDEDEEEIDENDEDDDNDNEGNDDDEDDEEPEEESDEPSEDDDEYEEEDEEDE